MIVSHSDPLCDSFFNNKYFLIIFGALVLPTLHSQYASTCFLVEHPSEIDVRAVACSLS